MSWLLLCKCQQPNLFGWILRNLITGFTKIHVTTLLWETFVQLPVHRILMFRLLKSFKFFHFTHSHKSQSINQSCVTRDKSRSIRAKVGVGPPWWSLLDRKRPKNSSELVPFPLLRSCKTSPILSRVQNYYDKTGILCVVSILIMLFIHAQGTMWVQSFPN